MTEKQKKHEARLKRSIRELMKDKGFAMFIWEILSECEVYNAGYFDDSLLQYTSGKRAVGTAIMALLDMANPEYYPNLLIQHRRKEK